MNFPINKSDEEVKLLMARAVEMMRREQFEVAFSDFLTPREQRIFYVAAATEGQAERLFFYGGARGAERRRAVLLPEWSLPEDCGEPFSAARDETLYSLAAAGTWSPADAVTVLCLRGSGFVTLSHRDWMGGLLALGTERTVIGDIFVQDEYSALVFVTPHIAEYLTQSLHHVGSDTVRAEPVTLPESYEIVHNYERIEATVASPRLDGVVHALTNLSRADAATLVKNGLAERNYFPETRPDIVIEDGDLLSLRGYGKYIIDSTNAVTRRGRNRLVARKFI